MIVKCIHCEERKKKKKESAPNRKSRSQENEGEKLLPTICPGVEGGVEPDSRLAAIEYISQGRWLAL